MILSLSVTDTFDRVAVAKLLGTYILALYGYGYDFSMHESVYVEEICWREAILACCDAETVSLMIRHRDFLLQDSHPKHYVLKMAARLKNAEVLALLTPHCTKTQINEALISATTHGTNNKYEPL